MAGALTAAIAAAFSGVTADPYFEYTTLLLPGNGTNLKNNNEFLDSSANAFTITRNPLTGPNAPTQGTFSPFSQTGWGNYFDGTGDNLVLPSSSNLAFGTGDFCVEAWVYWTATGVLDAIYSNATNSAGGDTQFSFILTPTNKVQVEGWSAIFLTGATSVVSNTWNHIVVCRSGTTLSIFLNGTRDATTTTSNNWSSTNAFYIGDYPVGGSAFSGYISNLRVVKGSTPYDATSSSLTVPTAPLTAITNTQLLTCQSNRFRDASTNNFTITRNGDTRVVAFSPFNPTASWSAATNGGSGYFDGSGDYLSVADNANLRLGTNAFTIQAWVYRNASGTAHSIIAKGAASTGYVLQVTSTNVLRFTHGTTNVDTTTTIPSSAWTHVAAVRTNTSTNGFQLYINGVSSATATVSTDFNQTDTLYIGGDRSAANVMNGYISGLKYTNGTAETISVPTEPPTATTNVALLTNFTNAGIYDATSKNDLETVGNAQISTAQSKWGGSSMSFNGSSNTYLSIPSYNPDLMAFGSGDFTIEFWLYLNSTSTIGVPYDGRPSGMGTASVPVLYIQSAVIKYLVSGADRITGSTLSTGQWYHIALARSSGSTKLFINGTQSGSTYSDSTVYVNSSGRPLIGGDGNTLGQNLLNGYMQDLRVTKGYARYTANFTAPTAAFPTL